MQFPIALMSNLRSGKLLSCSVFVLAYLLVFPGNVFAGTGYGAPPITVKGQVNDVSKAHLSNVTVQVKGSATTVLTDGEGNFSITTEDNAVLVFSFVGYSSREVPVNGRTAINITLEQNKKQLDEVVVTALGIRREKRSLGYSVTTVAGSSLTEARETNFVNGLEGKVAGVNVSNVATGPGGSANVVIRGISDITGSNQPLYVIDGIPMQNNTYRQTDVSGGYGGADGGDGTININSDDIETISVLKGAAATALYGYRGSKGVILITTKSGKSAKGSGVELNSNYVVQNVIDNTDWQSTYGQGNNGNKPVTGNEAFTTGLSSWGAKLGSSVYHFDGVQRPYSAVETHYKNGVLSAITQLAVYGAGGAISDADAETYYEAHPYDDANGLDMINTQFWAATFFNEYEAWSNYRRTGFPALVPVSYPGSQSLGAIPRRMAYSTIDKQVNADNYNAAVGGLQGGDKITSRMWWDTQ